MIRRGKQYDQLLNELKASGVRWSPGMSMLNSNGDIATTTLGYQYTIQTTHLIRAKVITQKFYEVPPADFVPIEVGEGAWMEDIQTNLVYQTGGVFERGIQSIADPTDIAQVSVGLAPVPAKIVSWAMGYTYSNMELEKALAADNWDVVSAKTAAVKKLWDLGIQKVAFLGLLSDPTNVPGLLSNSAVNANTAIITQAISTMTVAQLQTLISLLLADYFTNSNNTVLPDTFIMPMSDYLGMGVPYSGTFPVTSMLQYFIQMFREITQNPNFKVMGVLYANQASNTGYWRTGGTNRYVLYRKDPEVIRMVLPVDLILNAPATPNNFNWEGVGVGQFTGAVAYRPAEIRYYDWHT
jgi:hypothetical protein